ncbi:hypothetical protein TNCV_4780031 [Trichonephila clavipes]|nr:hypothetical protein TNCV_4780031 [Trichonephila clavipes]
MTMSRCSPNYGRQRHLEFVQSSKGFRGDSENEMQLPHPPKCHENLLNYDETFVFMLDSPSIHPRVGLPFLPVPIGWALKTFEWCGLCPL